MEIQVSGLYERRLELRRPTAERIISGAMESLPSVIISLCAPCLAAPLAGLRQGLCAVSRMHERYYLFTITEWVIVIRWIAGACIYAQSWLMPRRAELILSQRPSRVRLTPTKVTQQFLYLSMPRLSFLSFLPTATGKESPYKFVR